MKKNIIGLVFLLLVKLQVFGQAETIPKIEESLPAIGAGFDDDGIIPLPGLGFTFNDIWGYSDQTGEYAILGSVKGTYFINITDPTLPLDGSMFFFGNDTVGLNRDFKTYGHYAYGVCDQGKSSLQIFDLSGLPGTVTKVYDSDSLSVRCHTIFISGDKLFMASNTTKNGYHAMDVFSLADPVNPQFLSTLSSTQFGGVHAVFVRNDTAFASCGTAGMFVYDYTDAVHPKLIQSFTGYPQAGYNHSSWTTDNGKYLIFADETHGAGLKLFDISDITNPVLQSIFRSNLLHATDSLGAGGSIAHNPYILGNKAIVSYYHDGVVMFDISDPQHPTTAAYYDTEPTDSTYLGYDGCWGVYPFLPSNHIIASDVHNGLFVLDGASVLLGEKKIFRTEQSAMMVFPNPVSDEFYFNANMKRGGVISYEVTDVTGKVIFENSKSLDQGNTIVQVNCHGLAAGTYIVRARGENFSFSGKWIKM